MSDSEGFNASFQAVKDKSANTSKPPRFLTYLVFHGHSVRIGLELTVCIFLYILMRVSLPWTALGVDPKWESITAWFGACAVIGVIDQLFLCKSVYTLRKSCRIDIAGNYDRALSLLESIGPDSKASIPCPSALYHYYRGQFLLHLEQFDVAEVELASALSSGLNTEQYYMTRAELFRRKGDFEQALTELKEVEGVLGKTPLVALEHGITLLEAREDFRAAKRALKAVTEMPSLNHPSGETTSAIAHAYLEVSRLRTGEAEEGIVGLNRAIQQFHSTSRYIETLRPLVSALMLEKAYYLATHKEPEEAIRDVHAALSLCQYPHLIARSKEIGEELEWRHQMSLQ